MLESLSAANVEALVQERMREYARETAHQQLVQQAQAVQPHRARQVAGYALLRCGRLLLRAGARLAEPRIA